MTTDFRTFVRIATYCCERQAKRCWHFGSVLSLTTARGWRGTASIFRVTSTATATTRFSAERATTRPGLVAATGTRNPIPVTYNWAATGFGTIRRRWPVPGNTIATRATLYTILPTKWRRIIRSVGLFRCWPRLLQRGPKPHRRSPSAPSATYFRRKKNTVHDCQKQNIAEIGKQKKKNPNVYRTTIFRLNDSIRHLPAWKIRPSSV